MHHTHQFIALVFGGLFAASAGCREQPSVAQEAANPAFAPAEPTPAASHAPSPAVPSIKPTAVSAKSASLPRIWRDDEATNTAKLAFQMMSKTGMPNPDLYLDVYRWENAVVEGWVQFDGKGKPDRIPLVPPRDRLIEAVRDRRYPTQYSGCAIISAIKTDRLESESDEYDWYDCAIIIQTIGSYNNGGIQGHSGMVQRPIKGRVKLPRSLPPKKEQPSLKGSPDLMVAFEQSFGFVILGEVEVQLKKRGHDLDWLHLEVVAPESGPTKSKR
jgi:hypothetical protein